MSSHAAFCSRCGYAPGEMSDEQRDLLGMRQLRDRIYRLSMASYAAIALFGGGFGWFWWSSGGFEHRASAGPFVLMGLAALAYLVARALLFRHRRKLKALRKKSAARRT